MQRTSNRALKFEVLPLDIYSSGSNCDFLCDFLEIELWITVDKFRVVLF